MEINIIFIQSTLLFVSMMIVYEIKLRYVCQECKTMSAKIDKTQSVLQDSEMSVKMGLKIEIVRHDREYNIGTCA